MGKNTLETLQQLVGQAMMWYVLLPVGVLDRTQKHPSKCEPLSDRRSSVLVVRQWLVSCVFGMELELPDYQRMGLCTNSKRTTSCCTFVSAYQTGLTFFCDRVWYASASSTSKMKFNVPTLCCTHLSSCQHTSKHHHDQA